jgi:hypothetical protein
MRLVSTVDSQIAYFTILLMILLMIHKSLEESLEDVEGELEKAMQGFVILETAQYK